MQHNLRATRTEWVMAFQWMLVKQFWWTHTCASTINVVGLPPSLRSVGCNKSKLPVILHWIPVWKTAAGRGQIPDCWIEIFKANSSDPTVPAGAFREHLVAPFRVLAQHFNDLCPSLLSQKIHHGVRVVTLVFTLERCVSVNTNVSVSVSDTTSFWINCSYPLKNLEQGAMCQCLSITLPVGFFGFGWRFGNVYPYPTPQAGLVVHSEIRCLREFYW